MSWKMFISYSKWRLFEKSWKKWCVWNFSVVFIHDNSST